MAFETLMNRMANDREVILPFFELGMLADEWPDSYDIKVDSSPYYGRGDGMFHPSTHPFMGARQLYYRFHPDTRDLMIPERATLERQMMFAMGSALHATLQTQMQMTGLIKNDSDIEIEYVIKDHHVRGRIDWLTHIPGTDEQWYVEMKALACSTPILTTKGWSTMGELKDGDEVYAPDGQPTKVLNAHPIRLGRPCYEVRFRDGQVIVSDADHLWSVYDRKRGKNRECVLTTKELAEAKGWGRQYRFSVPVTEPLQAPDVELPIDPWLLGEWLGDGDTKSTTLTSGEQDLPYLLGRLDDLGCEYQVGRYEGRAPKVYLYGHRHVFEAFNLLGNKHIPDRYMRASEQQRRQLLAGLMDSDGTVKGHQVSICMVREGLMRQVLQLVRSLGYRATWNETTNKYGKVYWVKFSSRVGTSPFRMPRKTEIFNQNAIGSIQDLRRNSIVTVSEVETVPTRCITVAHESSLYLAGEGFVPTHNTINEWGYKSINTKGVIKPEWDAQLSLAEYAMGVDKGIILMVERGGQFQMREFRHQRNDVLLEEVFTKFAYVRECIENNEPPRYCCLADSKEMGKCAARHQCWLKEA
jgi:hypothetical protein